MDVIIFIQLKNEKEGDGTHVNYLLVRHSSVVFVDIISLCKGEVSL